MARIFVLALVLMMCGSAHSTPSIFVRIWSESHANGGMGDMAKTVCLLSEQSTKTIVDKDWDRVSVTNRDMCLKTARESYVYLAKCLGSVQGR
jgi:hypothetical protein